MLLNPERWRLKQTHPGRLAGRAVEAGRASGCAFDLCKPHLDLLALTSRLFEALGANERPGNVAGALMDIARDLA